MDVSVIIDKLVELNYLRTYRKIGDYQQCYCPFHSEGKEKKPSCGILLVDRVSNGQHYPAGFVHCFACGVAYTLVEAVQKLLEIHSISKSSLDWLAENIPGFVADQYTTDSLIPSDMFQAVSSKYAAQSIQQLTKPAEISYVPESELATYRYTVPYMYERKLTDELIEEYDIGVDMNWIPPGKQSPVPCITFPVRDKQGRTLFLCRRSIAGKLYNYPQGVTKPVYGIDRISSKDKSVLICESCINALTARRYGHPAVALLGTGNAYQIEQLKQLGVPEYVLAFDGDEAGDKAAYKMKKALHRVAIIWTMHLPRGKDINDLSQEEFNECYNNRE